MQEIPCLALAVQSEAHHATGALTYAKASRHTQVNDNVNKFTSGRESVAERLHAAVLQPRSAQQIEVVHERTPPGDSSAKTPTGHAAHRCEHRAGFCAMRKYPLTHTEVNCAVLVLSLIHI